MEDERESDLENEILWSITAADLWAAVDEVGPGDGTDAKFDEILLRVIEIAVRREAKEASGGPFRFLDKIVVMKN